jgi:threonine/homoserine/homoserine lactone efflux protein
MGLGDFLLGSVLVSLSGVMAPGPMTAVTVGKGASSAHAGALIALGHGVVELPLMAALFFGAGFVMDLPWVKPGIALLGGIFLLAMAFGMLRNARRSLAGPEPAAHSSFASGIILSIANPYFLVWWATAGLALIVQAARFGAAGFALLAGLHWLCDLAWFSFLSALSFRGGKVFGSRFQKVTLVLCGALLVFFGGKFIADGIAAISSSL